LAVVVIVITTGATTTGVITTGVITSGGISQAPIQPSAAWLLVGAPLCEELVFRAGLQTMLVRRLGVRAAVVVASLLFAAAHFVQAPTPLAALTFLPSLALGATYAATGRLRHAVALHACFNAFWWLVGADALQAIASSDFLGDPRT
jgi:membrane protease YdiL (CAAX protease family)